MPPSPSGSDPTGGAYLSMVSESASQGIIHTHLNLFVRFLTMGILTAMAEAGEKG